MPNSISVNYSHTNEERKYVETNITKDNKIAYRNNGSYYVVGQGDDGFKNIPELITIPKGQGTGNIGKIKKNRSRYGKRY